MTLLQRTIAAALVSGLAACATTPSGTPVAEAPLAAGEQKPRDFTATGSVYFSGGGSGTSADFSDFRIVGPNVNMTRNPDGNWAGNVLAQNAILNVTPGRIDGYGVNLYVFRKGQTVSVQGMFGQRQVWFTLKKNEIQGTVNGDRCSFDLTLQSPGIYTGGVGCAGQVNIYTLQLTGDAANVESPPMPQLVLALIAVLP
jgi:hypothetical protein